MHPRVLIVGTVPYNARSTSRAYEAYFHNWERERLVQIFSNPNTPCKGHCGSLYQITDKQMLRAWLHREKETGVIFHYNSLRESRESDDPGEIKGAVRKMYQIGRRHTPMTHLLRGLLWQKGYWCTDQLNNWLDEFQPECVFLSFSNDYFINQIALYVSERFHIPIVACIGDDYYFNRHFSLNPLYHLYHSTYRRLIRRVFESTKGCVYISDQIRDKYNSEFSKDGETVYLTSSMTRRNFAPINKEKPLITYFGNIRIGRNHSLCDIADAIGEICPDYRLEVYSNEQDEVYTKVLKQHPFILFGGALSYAEVQEKMYRSGITIAVEGFRNKDIAVSRYALSTKAADALASGCMILAYGSEECGLIDYLKKTGASAVCTDKMKLRDVIQQLLDHVELQKQYYEQAILVTELNHTLMQSCSTVESIIEKAIRRGI